MMSSRGRGRGFRTSFSLEPDQPTPLYPVLDHKPLPLAVGDHVEYSLALKQEFRGASRNMTSFIQEKVQKRDVERYSDKYHQAGPDQDQDQALDWSRFPKELRVRPYKPRPPGPKGMSRSKREDTENAKNTEMTRNLKNQKDQKDQKGQKGQKDQKDQDKKNPPSEAGEKQEVLQKLESLEQKEPHSDEEEEEEKKPEEEEEEEQVDEDDFEEDTDYIMSYFDNGEEFGADSDDNMDEAVY